MAPERVQMGRLRTLTTLNLPVLARIIGCTERELVTMLHEQRSGISRAAVVGPGEEVQLAFHVDEEDEDHDRGHGATCRIKPYTGRNHFANRCLHSLAILIFPKLKGIGNGTVSNLGNN